MHPSLFAKAMLVPGPNVAGVIVAVPAFLFVNSLYYYNLYVTCNVLSVNLPEVGGLGALIHYIFPPIVPKIDIAQLYLNNIKLYNRKIEDSFFTL